MQVGHPSPSSRLDPGGHELENLLELLPSEPAVGPSSLHQIEQLILLDAFLSSCGRLGDHLLGEDVQRQLGRMEGIKATAPDRCQQGRALD